MPKAGIHPTYYPKSTIVCSCGVTHEVGGTRESFKVDICSSCHPFYSGTQKLIDTAGRVDRFREKMAAAQSHLDAKKDKGQKVENKKEEVKVEDASMADEPVTSGEE